MLNLGDTLVKDDRVLSHVPEALDVLTRFETESKTSLVLSLVSDYEMPKPPVTAHKINSIFSKYVAVLEGLGLKRFFEPVQRRVTLSTHAGVFKPDPRIFNKAIQRLRLRLSLNQCLSITENAEHVTACRNLGMMSLLFDPTKSTQGDFTDWAEAPTLITRIVNPESNLNLRLAVQLQLATIYDLQLVRLNDDSKPRDVIHGLAKKLFPVPLKKSGATEMIEVPFSVQVDISFDKQGNIRGVKTDRPTAEDLAEAADYVKTLEANKQISHGEGNLKGSETHELKTDERGRKLLTRKRFTAT
jgi:hypothetical protein